MLAVAPPISPALRYHWLPEALLEVSRTLPPVQNVVGPPVVIVGVTVLTGTVAEPAAWQPAEVVTVNVRPTLPAAPAV